MNGFKNKKITRKRNYFLHLFPQFRNVSNHTREGGPLKNKKGEREKQYGVTSATCVKEVTSDKTKEKLFTEQ